MSESRATVLTLMSHTRSRLRKLSRLERRLRALQAKRSKLLKTLPPPPKRPTVMYDSVTVEQIPGDAPAVAGYVGGRWPTYHLLAQRFPRARHLSIAISASEDATCLDVEPGDARPDQAAEWVRRQHARGVKRPVVYTSVSQAPALLSALAQHGIPRQAIRLWTAHYTGHPHLCGPSCGFGMRSVADATQYTDRALGRNLDESLCATGFWA